MDDSIEQKAIEIQQSYFKIFEQISEYIKIHERYSEIITDLSDAELFEYINNNFDDLLNQIIAEDI